MRFLMVIAPDLLSLADQNSILREKLPYFQQICTQSVLSKIKSDKFIEPSLSYLGMNLSTLALPLGPLTVAITKARAPERSVHFQISALSFNDKTGIVSAPGAFLSAEDQRYLEAQLLRLNSDGWTSIPFENFTHAAVWEPGSLELGTTSAEVLIGQLLNLNLPCGDGELMLRRFIDDSVNLLSDSEMNKRRIDGELPLINLFWPHGQGIPQNFPMLAIRYGISLTTFSQNIALRGIVPQVGWAHADPSLLGNGFNFSAENLYKKFSTSDANILVFDSFTRARNAHRLEHALQLMESLDATIFKQIALQPITEPCELQVVCPFNEGELTRGLALRFRNWSANSNTIPFDERALDESRLPEQTLCEIANEFFTSASQSPR